MRKITPLFKTASSSRQGRREREDAEPIQIDGMVAEPEGRQGVETVWQPALPQSNTPTKER